AAGSGGGAAGSGGKGGGGGAAGSGGGTAGGGGHGGGDAGAGGVAAGGAGGGYSPPPGPDEKQDGDETGVDCGGSCPACPNYPAAPSTTPTADKSVCLANGTAAMCMRSMLFSPELKSAEADDFGSPTNPAFVYGVAAHDLDTA